MTITPDSITAFNTATICLFFMVFAAIILIFTVINIILLKHIVKTQLIVVTILQKISQSCNLTRKIDHKETALSAVTRSA